MLESDALAVRDKWLRMFVNGSRFDAPEEQALIARIGREELADATAALGLLWKRSTFCPSPAEFFAALAVPKGERLRAEAQRARDQEHERTASAGVTYLEFMVSAKHDRSDPGCCIWCKRLADAHV